MWYPVEGLHNNDLSFLSLISSTFVIYLQILPSMSPSDHTIDHHFHDVSSLVCFEDLWDILTHFLKLVALSEHRPWLNKIPTKIRNGVGRMFFYFFFSDSAYLVCNLDPLSHKAVPKMWYPTVVSTWGWFEPSIVNLIHFCDISSNFTLV